MKSGRCSTTFSFKSERVAGKAHNGNKADYDGDDFDVSEGLVEDVIDGVINVKEEVDYLVNRQNAEDRR